MHYLISLVECYYGLLRHIYNIITIKVTVINSKLVLQMAFKALNNLARLHRLVFTLLVFSAYPQMTELDAFSATITQHTVAMRKAMDKI